jgi:subtilisin family serine protease
VAVKYRIGIAAVLAIVILAATGLARSSGLSPFPREVSMGVAHPESAASSPVALAPVERTVPPEHVDPAEPAERIVPPARPRVSPRPSNAVDPLRRVGVEGSAAALRASAKRLGLRVVDVIAPLGVVIVEPTDEADTPEALAFRIRRSGVARSARPAVPVYAAVRPNDTYFGLQWGYENTGQSGGKVGADTKAVQAWDWSRGTGTVVAVTDTGVQFGHTDLAGKAWTNPNELPGNGIDDDGNGYIDDVNGYDFHNGDSSVFDLADGDMHGTHVAGTIGAATNNGVGVAGMGWDTRIMAVKFLGPGGGSDLAAASAITYAVDNGADVINASWGASAYSSIVDSAVQYAASRGVLMICAAGNEGVNTDTSPRYPAALPATNVVSVAALDRSDGLASFSNRGATTVDLGAPGVSIASNVPRLPGAVFNDTPVHKTVYLSFPLESITSSTVRNNMMSAAMGALATSTANPVLVVDDAWQSRSTAVEPAGGRLTKYLSMLSATGYSNVATWSVEASGTPPAATMAGKTVVWFTGACSFSESYWPTIETHGTLTTTERTALQTFLGGGGRLLISSGELAWESSYLQAMKGTLTWLKSSLGATYLSDDPGLHTVSGVSGSIFSGLSGTLSDPFVYSYKYDEIGPVGTYSSPITMWPHDYQYMNGTSMAAPHVSGTVALMLSRTPTLTADVARQRLLGTTVPVASLAGLTVTGGRLDAASAVGTLSAPAALRAWPVATDAFALAWSDPGDADFETSRLLVRGDAEPTGPTDPSATLLYEGTAGTFTHSGLTSGTVLNYAVYSRATLGGWSAPSRLATTFSEPPDGQPIPAGTDVSVNIGSLTLTFPWVGEGGWLSIRRIEPRHDSPVGTRWVDGEYYEITPMGEYGTPVDIALAYDRSGITADEAELRFLHRIAGDWEDVTVSVDGETGVLLARTGSFSDFGLIEPMGGTEVNAAEGATLAWGLAMLAALYVGRRRISA